MNNKLLKYFRPITQRRIKAFFKQGRAKIALSILLPLILLSFTAEIWSNSVPLFMIRENVTADGKVLQGKRYFFPVFFNYTVEDFGIEDSMFVDYKEIITKDMDTGKDTFALWPFNRWDAYSQTSNQLKPPSIDNWLGTDNLGRDLVARLLYGIRVSLVFAVSLWFLATSLGIFIGAVQGYIGAKTDILTERFKELLTIIDFFAIIIIVNSLFEVRSMWITLFILLIWVWMGTGAQMRAQFFSLRKKEFCEAAKAQGASHIRIIFTHILPNALTPIIAMAPINITRYIMLLLTLDFLGYGLNPPTPSIGEIFSQGNQYITSAWWLIVFATITIVTLNITINLIGESLREAFDPRSNNV